jgi:steroid 5-alpha reductase family enzyme
VSDTPPAIRLTLASLCPAATGALAVFYAGVASGDWTRRSAIGWMMGSWGARLAVQTLYTSGHVELCDNEPEHQPGAARRVPYLALLGSAVFFSLPAFIASINPDPTISTLELTACALWLVAFAGEATADRQILRFAANPAHAGVRCRAGIWRVIPHAHAVCEALIWMAFGLFACASPWGWIALACPAAMVRLLFKRTVIPRC